MSEMFREGGKTLLGNLRTYSGTLALTDGVHASAFKGFQGLSAVSLDLQSEDVDIPVYGLIADGKRYILLAVDEAKPIQAPSGPVEIAEDAEIEPEDAETGEAADDSRE